MFVTRFPLEFGRFGARTHHLSLPKVILEVEAIFNLNRSQKEVAGATCLWRTFFHLFVFILRH